MSVSSGCCCLDECKLALSAFATIVLVKAGFIDPHVIEL